jgi:hypothetical protein
MQCLVQNIFQGEARAIIKFFLVFLLSVETLLEADLMHFDLGHFTYVLYFNAKLMHRAVDQCSKVMFETLNYTP